MSPITITSCHRRKCFKGIAFYLMSEKQQKVPRWYFGGLAGSIVTCLTHPLDLIKVQLQTQTGKEKLSMAQLASNIIRKDGVFALYSGLSASLLRQMSYTTTKFAIYDLAKQNLNCDTFVAKMAMAGVAGTVGGYLGTPADLINVRMQNDVKLPPGKRRNYKNAIDGLLKVAGNEGLLKLFAGASLASLRAGVLAVAQMALYDQMKVSLLGSGMFEDNMWTHFTCSSIGGAVSTLLAQPLDVLKTKMMNAKPGEYKSVLDCVKATAVGGPIAFFTGFIPALVRMLPMNVMTFIIYEKLRQHFGFVPQKIE